MRNLFYSFNLFLDIRLVMFFNIKSQALLKNFRDPTIVSGSFKDLLRKEEWNAIVE